MSRIHFDTNTTETPETPEALTKRPQTSAQGMIQALLEQLRLREVLLLVNTANNPYDRSIVEKIIRGQKLGAGEWDHIFSEASRTEMPEAHSHTLQAIHASLNAPGGTGGDKL